jgi:hypothetical protein
MGSPRGLYERDLLRVRVPDVLTMLVLAELSITPALALGLDDRFEWLAPWLLATLAVGLLLLRVDELLLPLETKLRWNEWGLAVIDRSGRVTRSLAWHALGAFRIDRCLDAPHLRQEILVLVAPDRELSIGASAGVGDLGVDLSAQRALVSRLEHEGLPREAERTRRRVRWTLGWTRRSFVVALAWAVASWLFTRSLAPSPIAVVVTILPALWIAHRAEGLLRVVRASLVGRGLRAVRVVRVAERSVTVDDGGRESVVEAALADPRDGSIEASRALGPLTWATGSAALVVGEAPTLQAYRAASPRDARPLVSARARRVARGSLVLALLAMLVLALGATMTASYGTLVPALARQRHGSPAGQRAAP